MITNIIKLVLTNLVKLDKTYSKKKKILRINDSIFFTMKSFHQNPRNTSPRQLVMYNEPYSTILKMDSVLYIFRGIWQQVSKAKICHS